MSTKIVDIHPHIISDNDVKYPPRPLFGIQSDWSKEREALIEDLVTQMDEAGIEKAAIVQSSTCYSYDNSYLVDSIALYPGRFTAVGSVDLCDENVEKTIIAWVNRGVTGLRLFTGGSTKAFDASSLDDPKSFKAWEIAGELGLSMCVQTDPIGLTQIAGLAKRFPKVNIILDHLGRPDVLDGAPYKAASSLFGLTPFENIYLKLTPRIFGDVKKGAASAETFFPKLVSAFGANRLAWGSNYPASAGQMKDNLEIAKNCLACISAEDQDWIFAKTAQNLYPVLRD